MSEELDPIEEAALEPQSATVDGQTTNNRTLKDLIDADRYLEQKKAAKKNRFLKLFKMRPGSARGE